MLNQEYFPKGALADHLLYLEVFKLTFGLRPRKHSFSAAHHRLLELAIFLVFVPLGGEALRGVVVQLQSSDGLILSIIVD